MSSSDDEEDDEHEGNVGSSSLDDDECSDEEEEHLCSSEEEEERLCSSEEEEEEHLCSSSEEEHLCSSEEEEEENEGQLTFGLDFCTSFFGAPLFNTVFCGTSFFGVLSSGDSLNAAHFPLAYVRTIDLRGRTVQLFDL